MSEKWKLEAIDAVADRPQNMKNIVQMEHTKYRHEVMVPQGTAVNAFPI